MIAIEFGRFSGDSLRTTLVEGATRLEYPGTRRRIVESRWPSAFGKRTKTPKSRRRPTATKIKVSTLFQLADSPNPQSRAESANSYCRSPLGPVLPFGRPENSAAVWRERISSSVLQYRLLMKFAQFAAKTVRTGGSLNILGILQTCWRRGGIR